MNTKNVTRQCIIQKNHVYLCKADKLECVFFERLRQWCFFKFEKKKKWIRLHLHDENKLLYSINQYKNILIDIYAKGTLSHILLRFFKKKFHNSRILLSLQCIFTVKQ